MPLVNVIRGERIDTAPLNVRTPILRLPIWLVMAWWLLKGAAIIVFQACRYWYVTGPALLLGWLYLRFGWLGPVVPVVALAGVISVWGLVHRASWLRLGWWPAVSRWRCWFYRRRWIPAMTSARLAVAFDGDAVVPVLRRKWAVKWLWLE